MWPEKVRSHEKRAEHDMTRALLDTVFEFTCSKAVIRQCALQSGDAPGRQINGGEAQGGHNASAARSQLHRRAACTGQFPHRGGQSAQQALSGLWI